jgi:hypothetical protein
METIQRSHHDLKNRKTLLIVSIINKIQEKNLKLSQHWSNE